MFFLSHTGHISTDLSKCDVLTTFAFLWKEEETIQEVWQPEESKSKEREGKKREKGEREESPTVRREV